MPVYVYRCRKCAEEFEVRCGYNATPPPCPKCQGAVKRVIHPATVIYKGSGFYCTDHGKS